DADPFLGHRELGAAVLLDLQPPSTVEERAGAEGDEEQRPDVVGGQVEQAGAVHQEGQPDEQEEQPEDDPPGPVVVGDHHGPEGDAGVVGGAGVGDVVDGYWTTTGPKVSDTTRSSSGEPAGL